MKKFFQYALKYVVIFVVAFILQLLTLLIVYINPKWEGGVLELFQDIFVSAIAGSIFALCVDVIPLICKEKRDYKAFKIIICAFESDLQNLKEIEKLNDVFEKYHKKITNFLLVHIIKSDRIVSFITDLEKWNADFIKHANNYEARYRNNAKEKLQQVVTDFKSNIDQ